jgi:outer membrane protein insertion porin family
MLRPNFIAAQLIAQKPRSASALRLLPLFASVSISVAATAHADNLPAQLTAVNAGNTKTVVSQSVIARTGALQVAANNTISTPRVTLPTLTSSREDLVVSINANAKMVAENAENAKNRILSRSEAKPVAASEAKVFLAQLAPGTGDTGPAAAPVENPGGLSVPLGKEQPNEVTPAPPPPKPEETPTPAPAEVAPPIITTTSPTLAPILGDARAAEGREITEIRVVGNRVIPLATIQGQIRIAQGSAFSERAVEFDQGRIAKIGFFASVQAQVAPDLTDQNKVTLTFIVVENRVVKALNFTGNTALDSVELSKAIKTQPDRILNFNTIAEDIEAIGKAYRDKGFISLVRSAGQADDGTLVFDLLEARISKIDVKGLKKTREPLVRRQIRTKSGDLFNEKELQKDRNRLYDMNFFQTPPDLDVANDPERAGYVIITLQFVERPTGQFSIGVGFDSRSKISGFLTVQENNFRGTGKQAVASVETGSRRNFELAFGNPFVGKKNASYNVSIYQRTLYRDISALRNLADVDVLKNVTYEEERTGGRFSFTQPLDYDRKRTMIYGYRNERARSIARNQDGDETPVTVNGVPLDDSGRISAFSLGFLSDTRDIRIDPSRGMRASVTVEKAFSLLGGNTDFTKVEGDIRRYIPLGSAKVKTGQPQMLFAARVVAAKSINDLPLFEQYYIGGSDTVRGYDADQQYGDNQFYGNFELRYRFQDKFQLVGFVDTGTAFGGRFRSSDSADFLFGYGIGARIQSPIGPIRLDLGKGDGGFRTHFAIGPTF